MQYPDFVVPVPLFHGTSSLFLPSIHRSGLGGLNPLEDLRLYEFAEALVPLIEQHLSDSELYRRSFSQYEFMARQFVGGLNYAHGDTYLSASMTTAARYALSNMFGSEILTYTLGFLQLLVDRGIAEVVSTLYRNFPHVFNLLEARPAPILIRIDNVPISILSDEMGTDPGSAVGWIREVVKTYPNDFDEMLQQSNFRLRSPIRDICVSLIVTTKPSQFTPEYVLYELNMPGIVAGT